MTLTPVDNVFVRVDCDESIAKELSDYFSFDQPGANYMRRNNSRFKGWDGKIRLFKLKSHLIYRGLVPRILEFASQRGYEVTNNVPNPEPLWMELDEIIAPLNLPDAPRDYQLAAIREMLDNERGIVQSPTGSGKSLIIYVMTQALAAERILIIVPTIGLVRQMEEDFRSYGYAPHIHTIQAGRSKVIHTDITISTWQSIYEEDAEYFNQFSCVFVDEVHLAKGKSISGVMEKCRAARYRYGFTGTLNNTECHRLILEGHFGPVLKAATTDELIKKHVLAKPRVIVCVLQYPEAVRKSLRHCEYPAEIDFLCQHEARNTFIALLTRQTKGPTLTLFQMVVKHGRSLYELLRMYCAGDRQVWYIDGQMPADVREQIRQNIMRSTDDVLVASYGTTQLGINIPGLKNLILAHPSKSIIRVLQSIGRVLRLAPGKDTATIIDICDDLRVGAYINHVWRHAEQRMQYYAAEGFRVTLKKINLDALPYRHQMSGPARQADAGRTNAPGDDTE